MKVVLRSSLFTLVGLAAAVTTNHPPLRKRKEDVDAAVDTAGNAYADVSVPEFPNRKTRAKRNRSVLPDFSHRATKEVAADYIGVPSEERVRKLTLDTGVLVKNVQKLTAACSDDKTVECKDGMEVDTGKTCQAACDGECCEFKNSTHTLDACEKFTGSVCKDKSCMDYKACTNARIPMVQDESCSGREACHNAGSAGGSIGKIAKSCTGYKACYNAASQNGEIGDITRSCDFSSSCAGAASQNGEIGDITNSCDFYKSCAYAAANQGKIGDIFNGCKGYIINGTNSLEPGNMTCNFAAANGGRIGNITDSCHGQNSCLAAAVGLGTYPGGTIGEITNQGCEGRGVCGLAAAYGGYIGTINLGCFGGPYACFGSAGKYGRIGKIVESSCQSNRSCDFAAYDHGSIGAIELKSCQGAYSCYEVAKSNSVGVLPTISYACRTNDACTGGWQNSGKSKSSKGKADKDSKASKESKMMKRVEDIIIALEKYEEGDEIESTNFGAEFSFGFADIGSIPTN